MRLTRSLLNKTSVQGSVNRFSKGYGVSIVSIPQGLKEMTSYLVRMRNVEDLSQGVWTTICVVMIIVFGDAHRIKLQGLL